jgi:HEAT repeat protein
LRELIDIDALLENPLPPIRATAAELLEKRGGPEAYIQLRRLLRDEDSEVVRAALDALNHLGGEESAEAILAFLDGDISLGLRRSALLALVGSKHPKAVTRAVDCLSTTQLSAAAWKLLCSLDQTDAACPTAEFLLSGFVDWDLVGFSPQIAQMSGLAPALMRLAGNDPSRKIRAVRFAPLCPTDERLSLLEEFLSDEDQWVKRETIAALGEERQREGLRILRKHLGYKPSSAAEFLAKLMTEVVQAHAVEA